MKTLILSVVMSFFALAVQAQKVDLGKIEIGGFVGPNMSNYAMQTEEPEANARFGYQVGGFLRYGGGFFVQTGLTYYRLNSRLSYNQALPLPGSREDRVGVSYLQLPLLLGVRISGTERRSRSLRLQLGPTASVLTGVGTNDLLFSSNDYRNLWFGGLGGAGLDVSFFSLDLAYQWGLSNAFSGNGLDGRYRLVSLSLGITF